MTMRRTLLAAAILWTLAILVVCWTPAETVEKLGPEEWLFGIPHFDKLVHAASFAGFAALWLLVARLVGSWKWVLAASVALAAITEVVQELPVIARDAGLDDFACDVGGAVLGLIAVAIAKARQRPQSGLL